MKELLALMELRVSKAHRVNRVRLAPMVLKAHRANRVRLAPRVSKAHRVNRVRLASKVSRDQLVLMEPMEPMGPTKRLLVQ